LAPVGSDDFDLADVVTPPLTTVAQSPVELARRAMGLLLERIQNQQQGASGASQAKILLPAKLMIRGSCGPHTKLDH
jgi:LacI family transcriptional regulator